MIGEDIVSCRINRSQSPEPCLAEREARTEVVVVCVRRPGRSVSSIPILPDRQATASEACCLGWTSCLTVIK